MEKNIFEGAKFGDKFLSRDNKIVIYLYKQKNIHCLINDIGTIFTCYNDGNSVDNLNISFIVVSHYQKSIDEEKLDKFASASCPFIIVGDKTISKEWENWSDGFKVGYRKAKEE